MRASVLVQFSSMVLAHAHTSIYTHTLPSFDRLRRYIFYVDAQCPWPQLGPYCSDFHAVVYI